MPARLVRHAARAAILCACLVIPAISALAGDAVLRVASPGRPASLDPHKITGVWENRIVGDMFVGLTTDGPDGSVRPGAAESWEVSDDGRVYQFRIRQHEWSDGTPVTANDFRYSLLRMLAPETASAYADFFWHIEGAKAYTQGRASADDVAIRVLSDRILEIRLHRPVAYFTGLLTHFAAMPVPEQAIRAHGKKWTDPDNIVVNGPFTLAAIVPNAYVELRRNPRFFDSENVALDGVRYTVQENREAVLQRYRAGEFDVLRDFPSSKAAWLREQFGDAVRTVPYLGLTFFAINHRLEKFRDQRVREALAMSLDRSIITEQLLGAGEQPAVSLVPPGIRHYGEPARFNWADWPSDRRIEHARELMREAGYGPDRRLTVTIRLRTSENDRRVALAAQSMWRRIWVDAELLRAETAVHYASLQQGDFDLGLASWLAVYADAQTFTMLLQSTTVGNNYGAYHNDQYDRLTAAAAQAVDVDERAALLRRAEVLALSAVGLIPVYHHASRNVVAGNVRGWVDNVLDVHRSRYLALGPAE